ncbi:MAG: DUF4270 domain-containing protein [Bacteroides sp.]|nr:DUF4270 domain-containing protein [Bacteroides sp.]MCM1379343.1 DUF4270 domain-containing protein [Bacteroides sp.]MCM1445203.1 DUF4270 domain-containing protein [Prevotella sp.]
MKQLPLILASGIMAMAGFSACDNADSLDMPGSALVTDQFEVVIADTFKLHARSIENPRVQSRTTTQLLGAIDAPTYGTLRADFVAQLFPSISIDTTGVTLDSVKVQLVFDKGGFVGDSLAPIGFEVFPLTDTLPYPIYSNFPAGTRFENTPFYKSSGFTNTDCHGIGMFTASGSAISDASGGSAYRFAYATIPLEFGQKIYDAYRNPATRSLFNNPEEFATQLFPGIYVKATFGSGRVTRITDTRLMMYYSKREMLENSEGVMVDSIRHLYSYYLATAPEVVSNTNIHLKMAQSLTDLANAGRAIIVSPAGRDVEMAFPIVNVLKAYDEATAKTMAVINTLTFSVPCDSIANGCGIKPADYLLMVLSKDKDKFFAANKLPDDVTSFVAQYNANTMTYDFGNLRDYVMEMRAKGDALTAADYTFTITPVSMVYESNSSYYASSSSTLSGMSPMVAMPSMTELLPDEAKITLTFSRQQRQ